MNIIRIPVESSQIASIGHDTESQTLEIEFKGFKGKPNTVYQYSGFPDSKWMEFSKASSVGAFFQSEVKGKYDYVKMS